MGQDACPRKETCKKMRIITSKRYEHNPLVRAFVSRLPQYFDNEGDTLYAERNVIKSFVVNPADEVLRRVVVKRYKRPNFLQRVVYSFFRASKARRAFWNAAELRARGIDTPQEIAFVEERRWGLLTYGYLVTAYDGAPAIEDRLTLPADFDRVMAGDFARFAAVLHTRGILHQDLNCTNVRYHPDGEHYSFSVIDINRMRISPAGQVPSDWACMDNLTRFCGRMDLFKFVAETYASVRHWSMDAVDEMVRVKRVHDIKWKRRKEILRKIRGRK